jgi:RNA recognition motif-containing protein
MNIYVGNLDRDTTEDEIRNLFARFGEVSTVAIMRDRHSISKGFGFVEMPAGDEANSAIESLNRTLFRDRTLDINQSSPPAGKGGRSKSKSRSTRFRR